MIISSSVQQLDFPGGSFGKESGLQCRRLPVMRETWVRSLGQKAPPGEGNGNPLQYSCLENPMDREAMGLQKVVYD